MKRASKRGQASSEYLIVSSLTLLIVIPAVFAFFQYSNQKTTQIQENQIMVVGNDMAIAAKNTYFGGMDYKTTINERFPSILNNITFIPFGGGKPGGEFVVYYEGQQRNTGALSIGYPVNFNVSMDSNKILWGQGLRSIVFTGQEDSAGNLFVNVTII